MPYYKKLVGDKCYLSPCTLQDADKWAEWENDMEVAIPLGGEAHHPGSVDKTRESAREMINRQDQVFNIVATEGDVLIGRCMLFDVDHVNQCAKLGIVIGEKNYWDKGYGQEATRLLLDYGFNLLNLNNIMLGAFSFNERAIACYKKVGFQEIGRRRQARIVGGKKYDVVWMDMLAEEFESPYVKRLVER